MSDRPAPLFAITGGPGAGKSTLIEALAAAGLTVVPEAGRALIRTQEAHDGRAVPWRDPCAFAAAMLAWDSAAYDAHRAATEPVFFDRGIPDVIGYLRLEQRPVPPAMLRMARAKRYAGIFICPHWPDIYVTDAERKQTPELAERTCDLMRTVYAEFGYEPVEVPRVPVEDRVRFVLGVIGSKRPAL